jgi:hypothetical protein
MPTKTWKITQLPIDAQYEKEPNYIKNRHLLVIPNNTDTVDDKIKIHEERAYVFCKTNFPVCAKWFLQRPRQGILRVVTFHQ